MVVQSPISYYHGEKSFPWAGLIEPKLFVKIQWLIPAPDFFVRAPVVSVVQVHPAEACMEETELAPVTRVMQTSLVDACMETVGVPVVATQLGRGSVYMLE